MIHQMLPTEDDELDLSELEGQEEIKGLVADSSTHSIRPLRQKKQARLFIVSLLLAFFGIAVIVLHLDINVSITSGNNNNALNNQSNDDYSKLKFRAISKTFGDKQMPIPSSTVHEDNEACLNFATIPKMSPRTTHIAIPYHFFRSKVENLEIKVESIDTDDQLTDQFTKGLPQDKFEKARKKLMRW